MSLFYRLKISFWFQIPIREDICEQMHQHLMQVSRSMACIINYYTVHRSEKIRCFLQSLLLPQVANAIKTISGLSYIQLYVLINFDWK